MTLCRIIYRVHMKKMNCTHAAQLQNFLEPKLLKLYKRAGNVESITMTSSRNTRMMMIMTGLKYENYYFYVLCFLTWRKMTSLLFLNLKLETFLLFCFFSARSWKTVMFSLFLFLNTCLLFFLLFFSWSWKIITSVLFLNILLTCYSFSPEIGKLSCFYFRVYI